MTLKPLFAPRSIAVVGASRREGSVGGAVFRNLLRGGFTGPVFPINNKAAFVQSVAAYRDLAALPMVPDLLVVAVPAAEVLAVLRDAIARGVPAACVLTAGFGEMAGGKALERQLHDVAKAGGLRVLGPNCLGLQNADPAVRVDATFASTFAPDGHVAFATQSGALGLAILDYADQLGLGLSLFASLGNKADIGTNDLLDYLATDARTRVVLMYLESLDEPERLRDLAAKVGRAKPIAIVKSGRSAAGARAAGSHTGAITSPDAAVSALCRQTGMIRASTIEDLFDVGMVLANQPLPKGRRVGIVTNAGGPGILAADALEEAGLTVAKLVPATASTLRARLPAAASVGNPVDILAEGSPQTYAFALETVLADPGVDAALAIFVPPVTTQAPAIAAAIVGVAAKATKPILSCFMGAHGIPESLRSLHANHIPSFAFPEGAAQALSLVTAYAEWRAAAAPVPLPAPSAPPAAVSALGRARSRLGAAGGWLSATESTELFGAWKLALAPQRIVEPNAEAVAAAAQEVGFPVVLKALRADLIHKTASGGIALGLENVAQLREAVGRLATLNPESYLVQRQLAHGEEWLVGAIRDPEYGPLVTVGAGGTRTELWHDVEQRLAPLTEIDLDALMDRPRFGRTLVDAAGKPKGDRAALRAFVLGLAQLAQAHPEVSEIEANPLLVFAPGDGASAVDVRVRLRPS